jgi:hypothetical protein
VGRDVQQHAATRAVDDRRRLRGRRGGRAGHHREQRAQPVPRRQLVEHGEQLGRVVVDVGPRPRGDELGAQPHPQLQRPGVGMAPVPHPQLRAQPHPADVEHRHACGQQRRHQVAQHRRADALDPPRLHLFHRGDVQADGVDSGRFGDPHQAHGVERVHERLVHGDPVHGRHRSARGLSH